jgi:hypothetical protein
MKFRNPTFEITDEERRAINWITTGHRTPASREKCSDFAEEAFRKRLDEALVPYQKFMNVLEAARTAEGRAGE